MQNLFDYATKELSQDAFLIWLIASAKQKRHFDEASYNASRKFLKRIANIPIEAKIVDLKVEQQFDDGIDVAAFITLENNEKVYLFIEDKVKSVEHDDQLKRYSQIIDRYNEEWKARIVKRYFKTTFVSEKERKRIKDAGWVEFSYEYVKDFFDDKDFINSSNIILSQYAKHVVQICKDSYNIYLPSKSNNRPYAWKSFFERIVVPELEKDFNCDTSSITYKYASLKITTTTSIPDWHPVLIIKSNKCNNGQIVATVNYRGKDENRWKFENILSELSKYYFASKKGKDDHLYAETHAKHCTYKGKKWFISVVRTLAREYQKMVDIYYNRYLKPKKTKKTKKK